MTRSPARLPGRCVALGIRGGVRGPAVQSLFLLLKQPIDFLNEFQQLRRVLLDGSLLTQTVPEFLGFAVHRIPPTERRRKGIRAFGPRCRNICD